MSRDRSDPPGKSPGPYRRKLPFRPGDVLADRYELVEKVARGGMAVVYRAIDRRRAEAGSAYPYVAVKIAHITTGSAARAHHALQLEYTRLAGLKHKHIVTPIDFDRHGEHFFLVAEWLDGKSLASLLRHAAASQTRCFDTALAARLVEDIAEALACAHEQGIVHGDVKPDNIFLTEERCIKLLDFGNASLAADRSDGRYFATRGFASCEMLQRKPPEPSDDVFGLGCVAYELLTGRRPYGGYDALEAERHGCAVEALENVPSAISHAVQTALALRREGRPHDSGAFLRLWREPVPHRRRRNRRLALPAALATGVALSLGVMNTGSDPAGKTGADPAGAAIAAVDVPRQAERLQETAVKQAITATSVPDEAVARVNEPAMLGPPSDLVSAAQIEPLSSLSESSPAADPGSAASEVPKTVAAATAVPVTVVAEEAVIAPASTPPEPEKRLAIPDPVVSDAQPPVVSARHEPGDSFVLKSERMPELVSMPRRKPASVEPVPRPPGHSYWLSEVKQRPAVSMAALTPVEYRAPARPRQARQATGWVDVSFAIAPTGQPLGIEVHDADPRGVFERSAIQTIAEWRFAHADRGRHVRTRLRFGD